MRECLHHALVRAALAVREPSAAATAQGQRALEPIVLHVRMPERAPVHVDVDELHSESTIPAPRDAYTRGTTSPDS